MGKWDSPDALLGRFQTGVEVRIPPRAFFKTLFFLNKFSEENHIIVFSLRKNILKAKYWIRSGAEGEVHKENLVSGGGNVGNIPKINKYWKEWLGIPNDKIT